MENKKDLLKNMSIVRDILKENVKLGTSGTFIDLDNNLFIKWYKNGKVKIENI